MPTPATDPRMQAIRADPLVGAGTCSALDECSTDAELVAELDAQHITTPADAVRWARETERTIRAVENDIRGWGGLDPLPELLAD